MLRFILKLIVHGAEGLAKTGGGSTTGTVTGSRAKTVKCEKCQFDYVYMVTCKATGSLSSPTGKEHHTVNHTLDVMLDNAIEPIPCPACGWLQSGMIPITKARYKRWMILAGNVTLMVAIVGMGLGLATITDKSNLAGKWELTWSALLLVVSIGLYAGRAYLASQFDPNAIAPEIQKAIGQQLSITQEAYEKQRTQVQTQKLDRREQAKRNMASGYGLPQSSDELVRCRYCGYHQEAQNKTCISCKRTL
jgi:hypothetical protein